MQADPITGPAELRGDARPMYFVPLTGRPFDVTDEVLERWAAEERGATTSAPLSPGPQPAHRPVACAAR